MVYALRGKKITVDDILHDFKQDKKGKATYVPQLARHLQKNGLKTRVHVSSSKVVSPAWAELEKSQLIDNLKTWLTLHSKDDWHLNNLYALFYLEDGGELLVESYTAKTLQDMLDRGSTLIVCVDEDWVWGHRLKRQPEDQEVHVDELAGKLEGHFVVVTGYDGDHFHVLDPFPTNIPNRHGEYDIEVNQLTNASLTWDPQIIEVLK
jgi:hypothetical protein